MKIKNKVLFSLILLLGAIVITSNFSFVQAQEDVVAVVNGQKILQSQVDKRLESWKRQGKIPQQNSQHNAQADEAKQSFKKTKKEVINSLIQEELLRQAADKNNITVSSDEAKSRITEIKQNMNKEEFKQFLKRQGLTQQGLYDKVRQGLLAKKLYKQITAGITVAESESKEYFNVNESLLTKVKVRQIFIKTPQDKSEISEIKQAKKQAQEVITKLDNGTKFEKLAQQYSQGKLSSIHGGQLPNSIGINNTQYPPSFIVAAFSLNEGEYSSRPIRTPYGFHILKVDKKLDSFSELESKIRKDLLKKKRDKAFRDFYNQFKEDSKIKRL